MNRLHFVSGTALASLFLAVGCSGPRLDFAEIQRPPRAAQMDAFNVFIGTWDWTATVENAEGADRNWTGTAKWEWALDQRTLEGTMSSRSENAEFSARGVWSWHPKRNQYIWWMFNDWGYPQQGKARYDAGSQCWRMDYRSVGLDGTRSRGRYTVQVIDQNTIDWRMVEWADPLRLVKKIEMNGTYKRRN